jgi:hypothetical protein
MMLLIVAITMVAFMMFPTLVWGKCEKSIKIGFHCTFEQSIGDSYLVNHQDDEGNMLTFCLADNSTLAFSPVYDLGEFMKL